MVFWQCSRNETFVSIPRKLAEVHLHAWLFSNPCVKVLIIVGISWSPDLRVQHIVTQLKNSNFDNIKKKIVTKLKISNSSPNLKLKLWKTQILTKLESLNCEKKNTKNLQNSKTQTTFWQNSKTQTMRKLNKNQTLTNYKTQMFTKLRNQTVKNKYWQN